MVKVVPGATRTRIVGVWDAALRLAVAAPPARGQANAAVIEFLAKLLRVKRGGVQILSGETRPLKRIFVAGLTAERVRERLQAVL